MAVLWETGFSSVTDSDQHFLCHISQIFTFFSPNNMPLLSQRLLSSQLSLSWAGLELPTGIPEAMTSGRKGELAISFFPGDLAALAEAGLCEAAGRGSIGGGGRYLERPGHRPVVVAAGCKALLDPGSHRQWPCVLPGQPPSRPSPRPACTASHKPHEFQSDLQALLGDVLKTACWA